MAKIRVAIIDDWQDYARKSADWSQLERRAEVVFFQRHFPAGTQDQAAALLADFDIIQLLRERSWFHEPMLQRLPRLKMLALTGLKNPHIDFDFCTKRGIVCSQASSGSPAYAAEMALALMLAAARHIPTGDASIRAGRFQEGVTPGTTLEGRTLGIVGLGRLGNYMARYGQMLGMKLLAWSPNLTAEKAHAAKAEWVSKERLFAESDVVSLHLVLSERTRHIIGAPDLRRMKKGAILVNTSRGPLIDQEALLDALHSGRIIAALDVYDEEPLPKEHPIRNAPNTVLTPHVGFTTIDGFRDFYRGSIENIIAFLDGAPIRVANPDVLRSSKI